MANDFRRGGQEPEPKPFSKVLITRGKAQREVTPHDKFLEKSFTGKLTCILTALTPIHVGSGIYELDEKDNPVRGLITFDGKVIVPGSSLKGAIRSIAEAISDSCVRIAGGGVKSRLAKRDAQACSEVKSGNPHPKLCVCCSIFGGLGYQGRVSFTDARLNGKTIAIHNIQSPYPPRESARGYQDAQRLMNGRKFYYHGEPVNAQKGEPYQVIAAKSELECEMHFESLTAEELCLLLVAMGVFDDFMIKIGGAKQAMLGTIEVLPVRLELQNPTDSFMDFSSGVEVVDKDVSQHLLNRVGEASRLVNEDALEQLMKIWQYPSERKAPTTMY